MTENYYYDILFPSTVVYKDHRITDQPVLIDLSKKIIEEHGRSSFYSSCSTTVNTKVDILDMAEFSEIRSQIVETIGAFCESTKLSRKSLKFTGSWLNFYDIGGYQDLHHHSHSTMSGVYYLDSDGNKDLIFQAPWHFFQSIEAEVTEPNTTNCHNVEYCSLPGRCYVFMSHLMHRTLPAKSQRISISFNVVYDKDPQVK